MMAKARFFNGRKQKEQTPLWEKALRRVPRPLRTSAHPQVTRSLSAGRHLNALPIVPARARPFSYAAPALMRMTPQSPSKRTHASPLQTGRAASKTQGTTILPSWSQ